MGTASSTAKIDRKYSKLQKALNTDECPLKEKYTLLAIKSTFFHEDAQIFTNCILEKLQMNDMIITWKCCVLVHNVLREGHPLCLDAIQAHRAEIITIKKHGERYNDYSYDDSSYGYGKLTSQYADVFIAKANFHRWNPDFSGKLNTPKCVLEKLMGLWHNNDACLRMSSEISNYLDPILELLRTVLTLSKHSLTTMQSQCRLSSIIPCMEDAFQLYNCNVKILHKLHSIMHFEDLESFRKRCLNQFSDLNSFFHHIDVMKMSTQLRCAHFLVTGLLGCTPNFKSNTLLLPVIDSLSQSPVLPEVEEVPEEYIKFQHRSQVGIQDSSPNFKSNTCTYLSSQSPVVPEVEEVPEEYIKFQHRSQVGIQDSPQNFKSNTGTYLRSQSPVIPEIEEELEAYIHFQHRSQVGIQESPPNFKSNTCTYLRRKSPVIPAVEEELEGGYFFEHTFQVVGSSLNLESIEYRDNIIRSLHQYRDILRENIQKENERHLKETEKLQDDIKSLEAQLTAKGNQLYEEKVLTKTNTLTLMEYEELNADEEKYKHYYLKIREDHIHLLREVARIPGLGRLLSIRDYS